MAEKYISQFTGQEIDERLAAVSEKYGVIRMSDTIDENNFYSLECFHSKADEALYDSDPETYADLITRVTIPISTVQGDAFTATLKTSLANDANIVITDDNFEIPLNYRSIKISQLGNENAGYTGTLIIENSTDGSSWNRIGTIPNVLLSKEIDDTDTYQNVPIGQYINQGRQQIRVRATYNYTNEDGDEKTVTSGNVMIGASVTKTSLRLVLTTEYHMPMTPTDVNGNVKDFNVSYQVFGSVQKTLFLKIDNGSELKYEFDSSVDSVVRTVSATGASYLTHGIHKVEAWLQCEDGLGHTITSEKLVNRFMMVADASNTKPYLMLQNLDGTIGNFVQTELCEYAVYAPNQESVNVAFLLTAYTTDYETNKPAEYFRLEQQVVPQTPNKLLTTVEIEAENDAQAQDTYNTYFRVRRIDGTTETDFMKESTGETSYLVIVDNTNGMTPVSGATFLMNPKTRNNNEANPMRILNAKNNNAEVPSEWKNIGLINDGWVSDASGNKVLRIMAGGQLEIKKNVWAQFRTNPNSSLTFEIDCKISNVTNTTDPIIQMFSGTTSTFRGLKMNALEGWLKNGTEQSDDDTLFAWDEDVRTHFSININHQVFPNKGDVKYVAEDADKANGSIALARVLVNGDCVRELKFDTTKVDEWSSSDEGSIIIGNEGADIDIYSIRMYESKQLDTIEILTRNFLSTLPKAEDKTALKAKNDLLDGGLISLEKCKSAKLNCMIWRGVLPYKNNSSEQKGWVEIWRYDNNGNYLPDLSGTICKETKSLVGKGQGSTAKTYYDWNLQEDSSKVEATIRVLLKDFHESISVRIEGDKAYIKGGNLGKNFPLEETEKEYPYANGYVTVPDGWIDGNGKYRGMGYMVAYGTALAQKRVIKINYASSMQSHLLGACKTYDLLHRKVVGATPLQERVPTAVSAKHTEPFMFFNQEEGGETYFKGMGTYGAAKADKVAWGYVKSEMPMYALIEGSDNNLPMTGFRVPFDKNTAVYDCDGEGWLYNGVQNFDFDLGATEKYSDDTQQGEGWQFVNTDSNDGKVPSKAIRDKWADIHNFIYLHGTNLKFFDGTFAQFQQSSAAEDTNYKYWVTQGSNAFWMYRYDFINKQWVNAGLLINNSYQYFNITTNWITATAYKAWVNESTGDYSLLNEMLIKAMVDHMKKFIGFFINEKSLQFNYCYVLGFLAGTDNSDKNTYYKIMPYGEAKENIGDFVDWFKGYFGKDFDFSSVNQLYFDGDDMDSILRTDNNSHLTKPYYIDRLHPYADDKPNDSLYEGMGNQLFNYVEKAYEETNELASVMNQIMIAATELITEEDTKNDALVGGKSLWGFLNKYFFNTQRYFPQIAYLEQGRIRYEFPELLGYISSGGGARSIRPITQSLGSQLQAELQYMNQRVIYMTSYAGFGAWGGDTTHSIGLSDANETFGFMPANMPDGSGATYTFTIQPHQYIYPSYYLGQTFTSTHKRTSPKETCTFTIAENLKDGGDTGIGICGINYISDLGEVGNKSVTTQVIINGKRLTKLDLYAEVAEGGPNFRPSAIEVTSLNVKTVKIRPSGKTMSVDLGKCVRIVDITIAGQLNNVTFPETHTLKSIASYSSLLEECVIKNATSLSDLNLSAYSCEQLKRLEILGTTGKNSSLNLKTLIDRIYSKKVVNRPSYAKDMQTLRILNNFTWSDLDANVMEWLSEIPTCELKGTISIKEDDPYGNPRITWDLKNKINAKFGVVDNESSTLHRGLLLNYKKRAFDISGASFFGNFYVEAGNTFYFGVKPPSVYCNDQYAIRYSLSGYTNNISIDNLTGVLLVRVLSDTQQFTTIDAIVYSYDEKGLVATHRLSKTIEIWNRPAQIGDLVYADGTFSSAETWEGEKTPIGICFYVPPRDSDGNILTKYANADDKQLRLMAALEETVVPINGENTSSLQWGAMPQIADQTEEWYQQNALYHLDAEGNRMNLTSSKVTNVYDVPAVRNLTSRGLDNPYIDPERVPLEGEAPFDYLDDSDEASFNYGFKCIAPDMVMGDGFAYNESQVSFNSVGERTLTSELAKLAGSEYKEGDIVNSGYAKTLKIIAHRNDLLNNNIIGADGEVVYDGRKFPLPSASGSTTEMKALGTLIDQLHTWASQENGLNDPYPKKWQQLAYPFVSACYAYQPTQTLLDGEVLADKFKAHNWFAPTEGQLARICWYAKFGDKAGLDAFKVARDKGLLGKLTTSSSNHWSVTEHHSYSTWYVGFGSGNTYTYGKYNSFVGRAVSAF